MSIASAGRRFTSLSESLWDSSIDCCVSFLEAGANVSLRTHASSAGAWAGIKLPMEGGTDAHSCASVLDIYTFIAKYLEYGADTSPCNRGGRDEVWLALRKEPSQTQSSRWKRLSMCYLITAALSTAEKQSMVCGMLMLLR
jgi:hypothetical protein